MATMTRKGARAVTQTLDRVASLVQQEWHTLGIPEKIAKDFAFRCDLLSDRIERTAGVSKEALSELDVMKEPGFNPEEIGQEKKGPLEAESDEPYMKGEFSQQENRELRERIEDNDLGMTPNPEPQAPSGGKQAGFARLGRQALSGSLGTACAQIQGIAARVGGKDAKLASSLLDLAGAVMGVQKNVLIGSTSATHAERTLKAIELLSLDRPTSKLAAMLDLAIRVAKKAEDDEDEGDETEASKKAGEVPPQFLENMKKKEEGGDKKEEKKAGEVPPQFLENMKKKEEGGDKKEEKKDDEKKDDGKKTAHGFNLFA